MSVSRQIVADQLAAYLHGQTSLESLVDWTERQVMEGEFESISVRDCVARLGLADVRAFGLTWEDCQQILQVLGFAVDVHIEMA
jgi:hypothetical protein